MAEIPRSFDDARVLYESRKRKSTLSRGVKIGNNTYLTWENSIERPRWFGVKLYNTNVVIFHDDNTIELNTGGWETDTTKNRINDCLDQYDVYSDRHVWWVGDAYRDTRESHILPIPTKCLGMRRKARGRREFEDGMILHPEGLWHDEEMKYRG